jgi:hypothetical protein
MKDEKTSDKDLQNNGSGRVHKVKRTLADYLNERVNKLSASHRKITLIIFGLLMGAICLAQVIQSLKAEKSNYTISIDKITMPKDIHKESGEMLHQMETENLNRVLRLKQLLDSLSNSKAGSNVFDSLIHMRPGLMDSVNLFIQNNQSH